MLHCGEQGENTPHLALIQGIYSPRALRSAFHCRFSSPLLTAAAGSYFCCAVRKTQLVLHYSNYDVLYVDVRQKYRSKGILVEFFKERDWNSTPLPWEHSLASRYYV